MPSAFQAARISSGAFSQGRLAEEFWARRGPVLDCSVSDLIWNTDLEFTEREECVRAMFDLSQRFFANEHLDWSGHMRWNSVCYEWHCDNRSRDRGGEDLPMQNVMVRTFSKLLLLDSEFCQRAARHGLDHLHQPETQAQFEAYVRRHASLTEESKAVAIAAAEFQVS
jgi:hypothetical protein